MEEEDPGQPRRQRRPEEPGVPPDQDGGTPRGTQRGGDLRGRVRGETETGGGQTEAARHEVPGETQPRQRSQHHSRGGGHRGGGGPQPDHHLDEDQSQHDGSDDQKPAGWIHPHNPQSERLLHGARDRGWDGSDDGECLNSHLIPSLIQLVQEMAARVLNHLGRPTINWSELSDWEAKVFKQLVREVEGVPTFLARLLDTVLSQTVRTAERGRNNEDMELN